MPSLELQAQHIADSYDDESLVRLESPTKLGRPLSLTPELLERVCSLVKEGHYVATACQAIGLGRTNYYRWCRQGEADTNDGLETPEANFWHTVKTAEAQGEIRIGRLWQQGGKDWPAYATWNERRAPERWGKRAEESQGPKVIVQIGCADSDVKVNIIGVAEPGNHNAGYQTQTPQNESVTLCKTVLTEGETLTERDILFASRGEAK